MPVSGGLLGLDWGATPEAATERLGQAAVSGDLARYPLDQVTAKLATEDAFFPSALTSDRLRPDDTLELSFAEDALVGARVRFGYAFRHLGLRSDSLSESAMNLLARGEFHGMIGELTARYGAPSFITEEHVRLGNMHVVGSALFVAEDGGPVQLFLGHETASLAGEMRWLAPVARSGGF